MNLLITICARGGSKGIPGKNIKPLNGKPLLGYSIEVAQKFGKKYGADIVLSTDSEEIAQVARQFSLDTDYVRPAYLADDKAGKLDTIKNVMAYSEKKANKKYNFLLDLDVTSPLRNTFDLETGFDLLRQAPDALTLFSVSPANRNPYFNMVQQKADGYIELIKSGHSFKSRQEAPLVYDMNASFYFYRDIFFEQSWTTAITDRSLIYVVPHICFDLDHPHDFTIMELLMRENLLGFEL